MPTLRLSPGLPPWPSRLPFSTGPSPRRLGGLIAIAGAHLLLAWALLQSQSVRRVLQEARPLMVAVLADTQPARPEPASPAPTSARPVPVLPVLPPPEITVASADPAPPLPLPVPPLPPSPQLPAPLPAVPMAAVPVPASRPPVPLPLPAVLPSEPRALGTSAIRYRVAPAIELPMASRRLGESGTVLLQVVVDVNGLPRLISLHRSSGFARLDEQALSAMRHARFQPLEDRGGAFEWLVIAPLQYDLD